MRRTRRLSIWLIAGLLASPAAVYAQDSIPLFHTTEEDFAPGTFDNTATQLNVDGEVGLAWLHDVQGWTPQTELENPDLKGQPWTLYGAAGVVVGNRIFVLGGVGPAGRTNAVLYSDVDSAGNLGPVWTPTSPLPEVRQNLDAVVVGDWMYAIGGINSSGAAVPTVYRAPIQWDAQGTPTLGAWSLAGNMNLPRQGHRAVAYQGEIYVIGGTAGPVPYNTVERATPDINGELPLLFTNEPELLNPGVAWHAAAASCGRLFIFSGQTGAGDTPIVQAATINPDGSLAPWDNNQEPLPTAPRFARAVTSYGRPWVVGGFAGGGTAEVWKNLFDPNGNIVSPWMNDPYMDDGFGTPINRYLHVAVMAGPKKSPMKDVFVIGGIVAGAPSADVRRGTVMPALPTTYANCGSYESPVLDFGGSVNPAALLWYYELFSPIASAAIQYRYVDLGPPLFSPMWSNYTSPSTSMNIPLGLNVDYFQYRLSMRGEGFGGNDVLTHFVALASSNGSITLDREAYACPSGAAGGCGDGCCDLSEDCFSCPGDCGGPCGGMICGDGICDMGEHGWCEDCPPCGGGFCGDGCCDLSEDCFSCPGDCGGPCGGMICGDGICDMGEHGWCEDCPPCGGGCGDTVTITVIDYGTGFGSISVPIESDTEPAPGEWAMLTEELPGSGIFKGTFPLTDAPPVPDGQLSVSHGDFILATYTDANDGFGSSLDKYAAANVYCDPLVISNVRVLATQGRAALIAWNTNYPSKGSVEWASCPACFPGTIAKAERFAASHGVWLNGLSPCTEYYFDVRAEGAGCSLVVDDNNGAHYGFTTQGWESALEYYDMENEPLNWTGTGMWHVSDEDVDPCANAQSDQKSWYYGVEGPCDFFDGFPNFGELTSPIIDLTVTSSAVLAFWHRLDKGDGTTADTALVQVWDGIVGGWVTLEALNSTTEGELYEQRSYDVTGFISTSFQVRFMFMSDGVDDDLNDGWYIDDVAIWIKSQNCLSYNGQFISECGNLNGAVDPGEKIDLWVEIQNSGFEDADCISGTLSTPDPNVTMISTVSAYPPITSGMVAGNSTPFQFEVDIDTPCGYRIPFMLQLNFGGSGCLGFFIKYAFFSVLVGSEGLETTLLSADFNAGLPAGWTVVDGWGDLRTWQDTDPCGRGAFPDPYMVADSEEGSGCFPPGERMNELLVSPTMDASGYSRLMLEFDFVNQPVFPQLDQGFMDVRSSKTGGGWVNLGHTDPGEIALGTISVDITAQAAGAPDVQVRVRYLTGMGAYAAVDNVLIDGATLSCSKATCEPYLDYQSHTLTDCGNSDGKVQPGEEISIWPEVRNIGAVGQDAINVKGTLWTTTPGVFINIGDASYPPIPGGTSALPSTPFEFSVDSAVPCGTVIDFTLDLNYTDAAFTPFFNSTSFQVLVAANDAFSDDMESGPGGWTNYLISGSITNDWQQTGVRSYSGTTSWHSGASAPDWGDTALESPDIDLTSAVGPQLSFWHFYHFDDCDIPTEEHDGGIVEVSVMPGGPWTQIFPAGGYPDVIEPICSNPLDNFNAFAHDSGGVFENQVFDLSAYVGNTIRVRFRVGWNCGNCTVEEGWYIDDVAISGGACTPVLCAPYLEYDEHSLVDCGNFDEEVSPGETVRIWPEVENTGSKDAFNVNGTLGTKTPGITITTSTAGYPGIPQGSSAEPFDPGFEFDVDSAVPCGTLIDFQLDLNYTDLALTPYFNSTSFKVEVVSAPPIVDVAILDYGGFTSYFAGGNMNEFAYYQFILDSDPGGRFNTTVVTDLSAATLAPFDAILLPDNAVPDLFLADVDAWFATGNKNIIAVDSAICYAAYSGFMWPAAKGWHGNGAYWNYGSGMNDQFVEVNDFITQNYTVGQVISSTGGNAFMFEGMLEPDATALTSMLSNPMFKYVAYRDVPGYGSRIVVLGPYSCCPSAPVDLYPLIRDAAASVPLCETVFCVAAPALEYESHVVDDPLPGNLNGLFNPGETNFLQVTLENISWTGGATNVSAVLSTTEPGVTILDSTASYPDIFASGSGASKDPHYQVFIDPAVPCGTVLDFTLDITAAEDTWTDTFTATVDDCTVFFDDMESGINGWTVQDLEPATDDNLWHQVFEPTCFPASVSPSTSWYFGQDSTCDFQTSNPVSGRLVSPVIPNLPPGSVLDFWYRRDTECGGCCFYDNAYVEISTDGGFSWAPLETGDPDGRVCDDSDTWINSGGIDLSPWYVPGDSVQIAFRFDSIDSAGNAFTGWMVDDVRITECGPVCDGYVPCPDPSASPGCSTTDTCLGSPVSFTANASGGTLPYTYLWDFDNGDTSSAANPTYAYPAPGDYAVTLQVTDSCGYIPKVWGPSKACGVTVSGVAASVAYDAAFDPTTTLAQVCGDGDTVVEPGEEWNVTVQLTNSGGCAVNNAAASLTVGAGSAVFAMVNNNPGAYGSIPQGGTAQFIYDFCVDVGAVCVNDITFDVTSISSDEGAYASQIPAFNVQVGASTPVTFLPLVDFNSGLPAGWTVVDGGKSGGCKGTCTWADSKTTELTCPARGLLSDIYMIVDSDCDGKGPEQDEQLITPLIDASAATTVTLTFDHDFLYNQVEVADVDVMSGNTGGAWVNVAQWYQVSASGPEEIDITAEAAGAADVQIRWHYYAAVWDWYWAVDNVTVIGVTLLCDAGACAACGASLLYDSHSFTDCGFPNGIVDPGETIDLDVTVRNAGSGAAASSVNGTLSTTTPDVTVITNTAAFPDVPKAGSGTSLTPFQFTVGMAVPCGTLIDFTLDITAAEGSWTDTFQMLVGPNVAIFKDQNPWEVMFPPGFPSNEDVLTAYGISYTAFTSADMGVADLTPFDKVVIASEQPQAFYDALKANKAWFESWISAGGVFEMHAADNVGTIDGYVFPGDFSILRNPSDAVGIVDLAHPIVTIPNAIADADLDGWNVSTFGYIDMFPGTAKTIIDDTDINPGQPVVQEWPFGAGLVVVTMQPLEIVWGWGYAGSLILDNFLLYKADPCTPVECGGCEALACSVTADAASVCPQGTSQEFTATPSGGVSPFSYEWDFSYMVADGFLAEKGYMKSVETWTQPVVGSYDVAVRVTDSCGAGAQTTICFVSTMVADAVTAAPAVDANPACLGALSNFTVSVSGGTLPYTYSWDFGDGVGTSTLADPSYTYTTTGSYTVTVTVTGSNGCTSGPKTLDVMVDPTPNASFTHDAPACDGTPVNFDGPAGMAAYEWIFGCDNGVVLNEINTGAIDFVELYNSSGTAVNLLNWQLAWTDTGNPDGAVALPSFDLTPGAYVQLVDSGGSDATHIDVGVNITWREDRGGSAALLDDAGNGVDFVRFEDTELTPPPPGTSWTEVSMLPTPDNTVGESLSRDDSSTDTDSSEDWCLQAPTNTGGSNPVQNFNCPDVIPSCPGSGTSDIQSPNYLFGAAGTYSALLSVTDANGCSTTSTQFVTVWEKPTLDIQPDAPVICAGDPCIVLDANPSGGTPPYTYLWAPDGETTQTICVSPVVTTAYSVTVTDFNGCSNPNSELSNETVTVNAVISDILPDAPAFCVGGSVTLDANPSGGSGSYTFLWSTVPPGTTQTITVAPVVTTTYDVTVTDLVTGCTDSSSETVTVNTPPSTTLLNSSLNPMCVDDPVAFGVINTTGGGGPIYFYEWDLDGDGATDRTGQFPTDSYSTPGSYNAFVRVTGANGCVSDWLPVPNNPQVVNDNPASNIQPNVPVICAGDPCIVLDANPSGGSGSYTFLWSPGGETTQTICVSPAGTTFYSVTVTDSNGCSAPLSGETVTVNPAPAAAITPSVCDVPTPGNVTLNANPSGGTPPYTYLWAPGGETTQTIVVAGDGVSFYDVTVTDFNGCQATDNFGPVPDCTCPALDPAVISSVVPDPACLGTMQTFTAQPATGGVGPYTYEWDFENDGGFDTTGQTVTNVYATPGPYFVLLRITDSCAVGGPQTQQTTAPVTVFMNPTPTISEGPCVLGMVDLDAGGPYQSYSWVPGGATTQVINVPGDGTTYTVTVGLATGCFGDDSRTTTVCPECITSATATALGPTTFCDGDAVDLSATADDGTGPFTYQWSPGGETTQVITVIASGTYSCDVTDNDPSCGNTVTTNSITVTVNPNPTASPTADPDPCCFGGVVSFMANPSGGSGVYIGFLWDFGDSNNSTVQNPTRSYALTGNYAVTVIVIDSNGCMSAPIPVASNPVTVGALPTATISGFDVCDVPTPGNVTLSVTPSGGTPPYTYAWLPGGETTQTIVVAGDGSTYGVTVTDFSGCQATDSRTVQICGGPSPPQPEPEVRVVDSAGGSWLIPVHDAETTQYHVYVNPLSTFGVAGDEYGSPNGAVLPSICSTGFAPSGGAATVDYPGGLPDDSWIVITAAAASAGSESTTGFDSTGTERSTVGAWTMCGP